MNLPSHELPQSARRLLQMARAATIVGLVLFTAFFVWTMFEVITGGASLDRELAENFIGPGEIHAFSTGQRLIGVALAIASQATGIVGLWLSWKLFSGYLKGAIFTLVAAARLRMIGWMVVLLAPCGMLSETIGKVIFTRWINPQKINVELGIGDSEVFALVFGLLIVIVGHIMYQAIAISEENQSFV